MVEAGRKMQVLRLRAAPSAQDDKSTEAGRKMQVLRLRAAPFARDDKSTEAGRKMQVLRLRAAPSARDDKSTEAGGRCGSLGCGLRFPPGMTHLQRRARDPFCKDPDV